MPQLVVEKGNDRNASYKLQDGDKVIVGRDAKAGMRVRDIMTSRKHFAVVSHKGAWFIKDLDSANGTFLNGKKVSQQKIAVGDRIQIGDTVLSFLGDDEGKKSGGLIGKEIAGYEIEQRLGRGAMGTVYLARQLSLDRHVAMKILAPELLKDKSFVEMFIREARACGKLNHPNIIQVYDVGNYKGVYFFSMEFAEKGGVSERIQDNTWLEPKEAIRMIGHACEALVYAERHGIVHRDIKPDNLFITADDIVKIGDLGLAHSITDAEKQEGVFGTPHYIAPEQARGEKIDHRADIYALGATFYRMVTGQTPYRGANVQEILRKQVKAPPPYAAEPPEDLPEGSDWPEVPGPVADVIYKMMAKNPDERYATAGDILPDLERATRQMERRSARLGRGRTGSGVLPPRGRPGSAVRPGSGSRSSRGYELDDDILAEGATPAPPTAANKLPLIVGGALAALALIVVLIIALSGGGERPGPGPVPKQPQNNGVVHITLNNNSRNAPHNNAPETNNAPDNANAGTSNAPDNAVNNPPGTNNGVPGGTDPRAIQRLEAELRERVEEVLARHDLSHRALQEPGSIRDALRDFAALEEEYKDHELLVTEDGSIRNHLVMQAANELRNIEGRLEPLIRAHDMEYADTISRAEAAVERREWGSALDAYRDFAGKYWHSFSQPIADLRAYLDRYNPDEDYLVAGFPGAHDIWPLPDGRIHALRETVKEKFAEGLAAFEEAREREAGLAELEAKRQALWPSLEFFGKVLNEWRLPEETLGSDNRPIVVTANAARDWIINRLEEIEDAARDNAEASVVNMRVEALRVLDAIDAMIDRLDFAAARAQMEELERGDIWAAGLGTGSETAQAIADLIRLKRQQLERAADVMGDVIARVRREHPEIDRPDALDADEDFHRSPRVQVREIRLGGADGAGVVVLRATSGRAEIELPLSVLDGDAFRAMAEETLDLADTGNADALVGASIILMELGEPLGTVAYLERAMTMVAGRIRDEVLEYFAWSLVLSAQRLIDEGQGREASELLDRFASECEGTVAFERITTPPDQRPLGR